MSAETASGFGTEKVLHFRLDSLFASGEKPFRKAVEIRSASGVVAKVVCLQ